MAMTLTVVTYLPITEEKPVQSKIELLKNNQSDSDGNDPGGDEEDKDPCNLPLSSYKISNLPLTALNYISSFQHYFYPGKNICLPPPKLNPQISQGSYPA